MRTLQSRRERHHAHRDKNRHNQLQMSAGKHHSERYFSVPQFECKGIQISFVFAKILDSANDGLRKPQNLE